MLEVVGVTGEPYAEVWTVVTVPLGYEDMENALNVTFISYIRVIIGSQ